MGPASGAPAVDAADDNKVANTELLPAAIPTWSVCAALSGDVAAAGRTCCNLQCRDMSTG